MIQLNTESKLAFVAFILIFLVTIQYFFHKNQQFSDKSLSIDTNDFHVDHIIPINSPSIDEIDHKIPIKSPSIDKIDFHNDHKTPIKSPSIDKKQVNFNQINQINPIDPFPYNFLHIIGNPDGTITRLQEFFPTIPPSGSNNFDSLSLSLSKDVLLDREKNIWVRIYLPRNAINNSKNLRKLPIVIFVHGGGFILYSAASPLFHFFCAELTGQLGALVISVEYRLAPENRLPAAYDDVLDALRWVKEGKDDWVKNYGNFSRCVLVGQSAGGNIVYNVMLRVVDLVNDLRPLTIVGMVLIQPAFGGPNRTGSELRAVNDPVTPLVVGDLMWYLALPVGADRSHEFCDPTIGGGSEKLGRVKEMGLWVGVVGCDGDPLIDRQVQFVEMLKRREVVVRSLFTKGGFHNVFLVDPIEKSGLMAYMENIFSEFR
ncbi:carboxylesterase 20-like [Silene latifolia]|uniref:carboxylesterase 20-like n=1 Tax=Silene latifolia TaxID=37657 RepID=UPI003D786ECC